MVEWVTVEECEAEIRNGFQWLMGSGYRQNAYALLDELGLSIRLVEHIQGRKSAYQTKKDGDWEALTTELRATKTPDELMAWQINQRYRISVLPWTFVEGLQEEFDRHMATLKGTERDASQSDDQ